MCQVMINIPEEVMFDTRMRIEEATEFARQMVALGYYTKNGVSIGYCAKIAGMSEEEFIVFLGRNHVDVFRFDSEDELLRDIKNA